MSDVYSSQHGFRDRFLERLRLQFLGAGNWKASLANSELPKEVTSLIHDVVQQTGLLRFEKSEITTELIHHFQDGHERGHSFEELVRDFGTADVAVSLFRSSKLRSRPMSVKAFRGSLAVFGGGLISYLLLQMFFHAAKPNPTVDYSAKLNEAVTSMPIDQQAWPLYRDVWAKHGLTENGKQFDEIWFDERDGDAPEVEWLDETNAVRLIRPTDVGWDKAAAKLESLDELLSVLRKGSKLPYVGTPLHGDKSKYSDADLAVLYPGLTREMIEENNKSIVQSFGLNVEPVSAEADRLLAESAFSVLLPHIQQFRRAARILRVDTRYAMQQGDHERAIENVKTIFGLGNQAGNNPILVCSVVGLAIRSIGFDVIEELIDEHLENLSDDELQALQAAVANVDFAMTFDPSFEQSFARDIIQRSYSDDGDGDGRMTAVGSEVLYVVSKMNGSPGMPEAAWQEVPWVRSLAGPTKLFTSLSRKQMEMLVDETYEELVRHMQTVMWEDRDFDSAGYLQEKDKSGLLSGVGIVSSQLKQGRELRIARQDAVLLALALHRYKRSTGQWPTKLDQLKGDWIDRTPVDRLSGNPLSFVIADDAPVVYSLGHDGDDDRGKAINLSAAPWLDQTSDGDWILWPTNDE